MSVYKRGYRRYRGPLTGRWNRFMVLPRHAWRRLYQQRLVVLLTMAALVWPILCAGFVYLTNHVELLQGLDREFREFIQVDGRFFSIFMYVQASFAVFLAALAGPGLIAPDSREQRAAALLQPAPHALELRPCPAAGARRDAVGRHVDSGPAPLRAAGGPGRRLVVPVELDARCGHGGRVPAVAAGAEPGGDGQFRLREVAGRGGCGQPRLLLRPDRHLPDDQRRLPGRPGGTSWIRRGRSTGCGARCLAWRRPKGPVRRRRCWRWRR